jgi:PTS system nitrogen regulatory IIA component
VDRALTTSRHLLDGECIRLGVDAADRCTLFDVATQAVQAVHRLNAKTAVDRLSKREARRSTALGYGIALPHADVPGLSRPAAAFVRLARPMSLGAPDGEPVVDVLVLLVPRPALAAHFDLLMHYRRLLVQPAFRMDLRAATDVGAIWRLFHGHRFS